MKQTEIHQYLLQFFKANDCNVIEQTDGSLAVQLTIDMDKQLMNRPFYWHYVEKTGGVPQPKKLILKTNHQNEDGELIHFGSPRLEQMFNATKQLGRYIRMYETIQNKHENIPLQPWLNVNVVISYICDKKKQRSLSLGLNLINGIIVEEFFNQLHSISLTPKIPNFCFTTPGLIKPKSGLVRLQKYIEDNLRKESDTWAKEALQRWQQDLSLLEHFYEEVDEKPEEYQVEKKSLQKLYDPHIEVSVQNGGIFYLSERFHQLLFTSTS
ncbi:YqhG family protein [Bacillus carboniphilus]|uniref:YqhG family protein n=1 Tax=Bacillus carboniphilus TaxID=86663 RepID=A0ABY9K258_9BACI|nr:YqhG family protein [Bacillus carboniphilus]WLR43910.1 YqhG family protein [Bacillus carboniphilus]